MAWSEEVWNMANDTIVCVQSSSIYRSHINVQKLGVISEYGIEG